MVNIVFDTNCYRAFCDADERAVRIFREAGTLYMPFIVLAELRAGFSLGTRSKQNEIVLNKFLLKPRVHVLLPDEDTTRHYAFLFRYLREHGTPLPVSDLWIASLSVQHNLPLYSLDGYFDNLPQLSRIG
jgi:predicted nucleic acid-binding protein